jgi:hypothetical protein
MSNPVTIDAADDHHRFVLFRSVTHVIQATYCICFTYYGSFNHIYKYVCSISLWSQFSRYCYYYK